MFVQTVTKTKPILIPEGTKFVNVVVWEYKSVFSEETGLDTVTLTSSKRMVNLALVSELTPDKLEASRTQWVKLGSENIRRNREVSTWRIKDGDAFGWARLKTTERIVDITQEVFRITPLHKDINLNAKFITFE